MNGWLAGAVWGVLAIAVLTVFITFLKTRKPISAFLVSASQGVCAIVAVDLIGLVSGVSLGFGWLSLLFAAVFGVPGVITLLLMGLV